MYRAVTRNIEVVVTPRFVADRSSADNNYFFWVRADYFCRWLLGDFDQRIDMTEVDPQPARGGRRGAGPDEQ